MHPRGAWVAANPEGAYRGYTINGLYYQFGIGPRWLDLVNDWRDAQNDPAALKTFVNDRLAETWEDPAMRAVKHNLVADRAEPFPLRRAPAWVLAATVGIDTQDPGGHTTRTMAVDFDSQDDLLDYLGSESHESFVRTRWRPVIAQQLYNLVARRIDEEYLEFARVTGLPSAMASSVRQ